MKRASFEPTKHSRICADHFTADCFQQNLAIRTSLGSTFKPRRLNLKKDAVPTIFHFEVKRKFGGEKVDPHKNKTAARGNPEERVRTAFAKRRRLEVLSELFDQSQSSEANALEEQQETDTNPGLVDARRKVCLFTVCGYLRPKNPQNISVGVQVSPENKDAVSQVYGKIVYDTSTQTTVTHQLQLRSILSSAVQCSLTEDSLLKTSQQKPVVSVKPEAQCDEECDDNGSDTDSVCSDCSGNEWNLNDIKQDSDAEYEDYETGDEDTKDETAPFGRKFLVFESNLFELFQSCYKCLAPAMPRLDKVVGSMIVIVSKCSNGHTRTWTSQKCDGRLPWGNMLCAAGTRFTGSNPARVASFFNHVGVLYMSLKTYYKIQRVYLAPVVNRCWENEQLFLLTSLKGKAIDLGGDA
ncbi:hypothetical protein P5673_004811, partial [Acropora cervicornis]